MSDNRFELRPIGLLELIEPKRWQRLQDYFASVVGIPLRTVDPTRQLLVTPSWPSYLDVEHTVRVLQIGEELETLLPEHGLPRDTHSFTTPVGVTYACVPILAERILGYIILGPMLVGRLEDEANFRQRIRAMGMEPGVLWPVLLSLKHYTFAGIHSVLKLMEEVAESMVQRAQQPHDAPSPSKVFASLLSAAALATKADGGSVMVQDLSTGQFRIHVARGLSSEIVQETVLHPGEGIAGLAAETRAILLIDERVTDERIRSRMHRKELVSSLVAPVAVGGPEGEGPRAPIGILNLRTADPQRPFTPEHVELLKSLLDLAGMALGGFEPTVTPGRPPASS